MTTRNSLDIGEALDRSFTSEGVKGDYSESGNVVEALDTLASAVKHTFSSPNVMDSNMEVANIVDVIDKVAHALFDIAEAIRESKK